MMLNKDFIKKFTSIGWGLNLFIQVIYVLDLTWFISRMYSSLVDPWLLVFKIIILSALWPISYLLFRRFMTDDVFAVRIQKYSVIFFMLLTLVLGLDYILYGLSTYYVSFALMLIWEIFAFLGVFLGVLVWLSSVYFLWMLNPVLMSIISFGVAVVIMIVIRSKSIS